MGSLVAAMGSYLQARQAQGQWLLRFEDLDRERNQAGAVQEILRSLESHGFEWDGEVSYQQTRLAFYQHALAQLIQAKQIFYCACSRKTLSQQRIQTNNPLYPGTCRHRYKKDDSARYAIRLRVADVVISFEDAVYGLVSQNLAQDVGDFVIRRADGFFAYQLAVVVDDAEQGITQVVRGADLLDNTPRQIYLQRLLGLVTPNYLHLPIITNSRGEKLGKQTGAKALNLDTPAKNLLRALGLLGQQPPPALNSASVNEIWQWAIATWQPTQVTKQMMLSESVTDQ